MRLFSLLRHLLRKKSGFYRREQLPEGPFIARNLPSLPPRWDCTGNHKQAKNHCAAVCVCNALLYFRQGTAAELFEHVHPQIGNGPVFFLRKAKRWFRYGKIRRFYELETALADGQPCALMISTPKHEWHWVLVVGCREYPDGSRWLRIADGWNREGERWYP
ncbi:MAG: hypothetical protein IJ411_03060, partial [Oscillospiraceae bacterium]|nr:hypothetical protein [Oscillospiraceae bacterium]